jgi:hypothetical protein
LRVWRVVEPKKVEGLTYLCALPSGAEWSLLPGGGIMIRPLDGRAYVVTLQGERREISEVGNA